MSQENDPYGYLNQPQQQIPVQQPSYPPPNPHYYTQSFTTYHAEPPKEAPPPPAPAKKTNANRVPTSLQNTGASSMIYAFDFKKDKKKEKRKKSVIGKTTPAPGNGNKLTLADFELTTVLGTGTFGKVHLCLHKATRQYYCMKILKKQTILQFKQTEHIQSEKFVLRTLKHNGIVKM